MRAAPGPVEWLTFPSPDDPDHQFRVNVSFLLSNYECIFDNRVGGRTGKPGCAFHHLAARKGLHHSDTKPHICWSIPLNFSSEEPEEPGGRTTTIVSAFTADAWGGTDDAEEPDGRGHVGFWCVDTPDAYRGASPVYRSLEHELRKGMGDVAYEAMAELLDRIERPRFPMPGRLMNRGLPMLPQLVAQRGTGGSA